MKNYLPLCVLFLTAFAVGLIHSCKKENQGNVITPPPPPPITTSFTEDFEDFGATLTKGWSEAGFSATDNLGLAPWTWGFSGTTKIDTAWYGFSGYSRKFGGEEFAYSYANAIDSNHSFSNWLLTPVISVKNGDKISFYTRGDTTGIFTDRMQVLMNKLATTNIGHDLNSTGDFTTVLYDINKTQAPGGYPTSWTKYEYTFSGLSGQVNIRIAFRHYVVNPGNARGVGIDLFKFDVF